MRPPKPTDKKFSLLFFRRKRFLFCKKETKNFSPLAAWSGLPSLRDGRRSYHTKRVGKYRYTSKKCRKDFTVVVGTVFEASHIPLHKWLLAAFLLCASKKGMSSHQLKRMLSLTYKTAWFMTHRIREAMRSGVFSNIGGSGKVLAQERLTLGKLLEHLHTTPLDRWRPVFAKHLFPNL